VSLKGRHEGEHPSARREGRLAIPKGRPEREHRSGNRGGRPILAPGGSLQWRLLALVTGVVAAVWLSAGVATWFDVRHELNELLDSHLAQAAALLVVQQAAEIDDDHRRLDAPSLHRYAPKVAFQVFHEGRLVLRSTNAPVQPMAGSGGGFTTGFRTARIGNDEWRVFATHGAERDVQVYVGERTDSRAAIAWAALWGMSWPMLASLPILAIACAWGIHRGLSPLRRLSRALRERDPRDLAPVAVGPLPREIEPSVDALNALFARIATLLEAERRFTADAAHELRTPIAATRAQAQVALIESDDANRRHALEATLAGCDRATRLVDQLLTLSRLESGNVPALSSVDLSAIARTVIGELAPSAVREEQTLELDAPDSCSVLGEPTLLAVLVRNLVENALRYAGRAAVVRIGVTRAGGDVRLAVEDSGPGLTDAEIRRLGERFFRVPGSAQPGSGLGWSIVRRIADAHRATIDVRRSAKLGGLAAVVTLASG
jgi:two-component system sensor histidine kinase QseC